MNLLMSISEYMACVPRCAHRSTHSEMKTLKTTQSKWLLDSDNLQKTRHFNLSEVLSDLQTSKY